MCGQLAFHLSGEREMSAGLYQRRDVHQHMMVRFNASFGMSSVRSFTRSSSQPTSKFSNLRPGYFEKSWSRVTHSHPCSIAKAAW